MDEELKKKVPEWELNKKGKIKLSEMPNQGEAEDREPSEEVKLLSSMGSVEQIAECFIVDYELKTLFGKSNLTEREKDLLRVGINRHGPKGVKTFLTCVAIYEKKVKKYGNSFIFEYAAFEAEANELCEKVTVWESYDREAEHLTGILSGLSGDDLKRASEKIRSYDYRGAAVRVDGSKVKIDVEEDGELYESIKSLSASTEAHLKRVKAYDIMLFEYFKQTNFWFMLPYNVEIMLDRLHCFHDYVGEWLPEKYFKSVINERRASGKPITPEDEKRAVFPDFQEIEADEAALFEANRILSQEIDYKDLKKDSKKDSKEE